MSSHRHCAPPCAAFLSPGSHKATPITTTLSQHLPRSFFARPAEVVAPELIGCLLVQCQPSAELLWGVIVETEAYSQEEPACHGYRRRTPSNETLFGAPGRFYVYVSYGIHHCVNVVTDRADRANGVLLRAAALPGEPERVAAGPGLLARRFGIDRDRNAQPIVPTEGLWLAPRPPALACLLRSAGPAPSAASAEAPGSGGFSPGSPTPVPCPGGSCGPVHPDAILCTTRIGIQQGQELPWRWYLRCSRSISRRARGDRPPRLDGLWALLADAAPPPTVGTPLQSDRP